MKKLLFTTIALAAYAISFAETVKINGLYYSLGATTAQVVQDQSTGKSVYSAYTSVTIPASVTYNNYTYLVTSIGSSAFEALTNLQQVVLPSGMTTINSDAFYGCSKLGSVNIDEGLTTIGARAFWGCALTDITIPSTVTSIGNAAFKNNPTTSVTWLPANCSIGTDTYAPFYSENSQIRSFTFGDSVQVVPAYLCTRMSRIDTIVLPPSVRSLGAHAFYYCTSLRSINLPVTQKTLPASFLEGCTSLDSIHLPATLTTISSDAFYGCSSLSKVNIDEGLTTIGARAFWGCALTYITIPSTVTSIGNAAFKNNPTTSVTWLPANCSIGTDTYAPFYSENSQIRSFTFGDNVQVVPAYLCYRMTRLDSIHIPATVTSIGARAFMYCSSLKLIAFPQGMTSLAVSVLEGCSALEHVVIPSSVTTINQDAFYGCTALQTIHNYAYTPQTITERAVHNVNKSTCLLYVPIDYISLYRSKAVWCDFVNIIGVATDLQFEDQLVHVSFLRQDSSLYYMDAQTWQIPVAPYIEGFTFLTWRVQEGALSDGIVLQAVYSSNTSTDADPIPASKSPLARKLIRDGNVYILRDDKVYSVSGQLSE